MTKFQLSVASTITPQLAIGREIGHGETFNFLRDDKLGGHTGLALTSYRDFFRPRNALETTPTQVTYDCIQETMFTNLAKNPGLIGKIGVEKLSLTSPPNKRDLLTIFAV